MKKFYTTLLFSMMTLFIFAQGESLKVSLSEYHFEKCKSCNPQPNIVQDTICNIENDDTLAVYYSDAKLPHDSGWAIGMNAYLDRGWAEKHSVTGTAQVMGGAYYFFEKSKSNTSGMTGTANVRDNTGGGGGKPGTSLGSKSIPFSSLDVDQVAPNLTYFTFASPVSVTGDFFLTFELAPYTLGGSDTIGIVTTRHNNRSTTNDDQNAVMRADGNWYFEKSEHLHLNANFMMCAITDIAGGVNNFVSSNGLSLYAAYPSPAGSTVTLEYALDNASPVSIEIFDAQGKVAMSIAKQNMTAGKHSTKVDVSSLAAGTYVYNVSTDSGALFSRFSVTK